MKTRALLLAVVVMSAGCGEPAHDGYELVQIGASDGCKVYMLRAKGGVIGHYVVRCPEGVAMR